MIREIFQAEINTIIEAHKTAVGTGSYITMFFLLLLYMYIHIKEENKNIKVFLKVYTIAILILIWNPIFAKILIKFIGDDVYWRVYWLLPIGIIIAYCFTEMIFSLSGKTKKVLSFISIIVIIAMSGELIYTDEVFEKVGNYYKVPDNVLEIIFAISEDKKEYKKVAGPEEFLVYTRQIDGTILTDDIRNVYGNYPEDSLLKMINRGEIENTVEKARERNCNYIVYPNESLGNEDLEKYGFKLLAKNDNYTLYKDMIRYE